MSAPSKRTHYLALRLALGPTSPAVAVALQPELGTLPRGVTAQADSLDRVLRLTIQGDDLWALRTSMHGLLRLVEAGALTP